MRDGGGDWPYSDPAEVGSEADRKDDERLAEGGDAEAMVRLAYAMGNEGYDERAIYWERRASDLGHTLAMTNLGHRLVDTRPDEAEHWWLEAAGLGWVTAMAALAWLYRNDDPEKAQEWAKRAAEQGNTYAMELLGDLAWRSGDRRSARRWYERVVHLQDPRSMYRFAKLLDPCELGPDVPTRSHRRATALLEQAARSGSADAALALAQQILRWDPGGTWTSADEVKHARSLLTQAAEGGKPYAMLRLSFFARKDGNEEASHHWIEQAAELGSVPAIYMLAALDATQETLQSRLDRAAELNGRAARMVSQIAPFAVCLSLMAPKGLRRIVRGADVEGEASEGKPAAVPREVTMAAFGIVARIVRCAVLLSQELGYAATHS